MKPVRGIETRQNLMRLEEPLPFQLMKPVRGIETVMFVNSSTNLYFFPINETRSRD